MNPTLGEISPSGMLLALAGLILALFGLVAFLSDTIGTCMSACFVPPGLPVLAFELALGGSALMTTGLSESAFAHRKIVKEGALLVLVTGSVILTLGFYTVSLPNASLTAAGIGYLCGLLSGSMFVGALAKLEIGRQNTLGSST